MKLLDKEKKKKAASLFLGSKLWGFFLGGYLEKQEEGEEGGELLCFCVLSVY